MGNWKEEMDARNGAKRNWALSSVHPFPLPSFPTDERAWIIDLPSKEETVLQPNTGSTVVPLVNVWLRSISIGCLGRSLVFG